jgi:cobalt-zinc-cadmium efflux system membrane fusion protein
MKDKSKIIKLILILSISIAVALGLIYFKSQMRGTDEHTLVSADSGADFERGPHHGRLLKAGDFEVEVTIFESGGVLPRFRIYFYQKGIPIPPSDVEYEMELKRINRIERIPFKPQGDYLESAVEISEPHSFKVKVLAKFKGQADSWEYETFEGRVELTPEAIKANAIKIEEVGPINLEIKIDVIGRIVPNEEHTVYISPRYPGVVKAVYKKLGDIVSKGEVLAIIESNESLKNYELKSEMSGMIIKKNINVGMYLSGQENVFVVSDLSIVWADFSIYSHDLSRIKVGDSIQITSLDGNLHEQSVISYISPIGQEATQSVIARAELTNQEGLIWKPGLFVSGEITIETVSVPTAVKSGALQTFRDWDVVYISVGNLFEAVPVKLGRRNKQWVEITSGLNSGEHYVSENSFILKADLEKSGAKHEH